jgi:membrane-bound lytic murein transglycosylase MltF
VLEGRGLEPVHTVEVDERYEDHDILEMVNAGLLPMTVVDRHKARFWDQFFDRIEVREDLLLREGGEIAWAIRKDSPRLAETLNAFVRDHRKGTLFGNVVFDRYLEQTHWVEQALDTEDRERFDRLAGLFRKYAGEYDLDWLLVAAQAYQESGLDPDRRSRAGAIGVMQLRPAAAREVGIDDVRGIDDNIHAGVKYLRHVMDRYFDDESLDPFERQLFGLAAYNAGPSRIRALRGKTAEAGLDPDRWFGNVEVLAARHVGSEPVRYVGNITKYYLAFSLAGPDLESPDAVLASGGTR